MIYKTDLFIFFTTLWRQEKCTLASTSHFPPHTTEHLSYKWPPSLPKPKRVRQFHRQELPHSPSQPSGALQLSVLVGEKKETTQGNKIPRKAQKWFVEVACKNYRGHQNPTFLIINFISYCLFLPCGIKLRSMYFSLFR